MNRPVGVGHHPGLPGTMPQLRLPARMVTDPAGPERSPAIRRPQAQGQRVGVAVTTGEAAPMSMAFTARTATW